MDLNIRENARNAIRVMREAMASIKGDPKVTPDNYLDSMFHALNSVNPAYSNEQWTGDTMPEIEDCVWIRIHRDHINFYKIDKRSVFEGQKLGLRNSVERQVKGLRPGIHEIIQQRGMDLAYAWQEASPALGTKKYDPDAYSQSFNHWVLVTKENAMILKLEHEKPSEIYIYSDKDHGPAVSSIQIGGYP